MLSGPVARALTTPNDPLFLNASACTGVTNCVNQQWNLMSDGRGISADSAWDLTKGEGTVVAVLDSGIDYTQPDLMNQIWNNPGEIGLDGQGHDKRFNGIDDDHNGYVDDWRGWDFYEADDDATDDSAFGHGTGTAGVVGAQQDNGLGGSGVAPGAKIMPLRVSDTFIVAPSRLAQAIRYAADNGANVISMSIGSIGTSKDLQDAVAYADARGVVMVDAMANEFSIHPNTPAYLDPVIGVSALVPDTDGTGSNTATDFTVKATYSNDGPGTDVAAPTDVYTTDYGGGYGKIAGTSGATPSVAGAAALVISHAQHFGITLSPGEVTQIIRESADDLVGGPYGYAPGWDPYTGWGRVDASNAVSMARPAAIPPVANITAPGWYQSVKGAVKVAGSVSARNGPYSWKLSSGSGLDPSAFTQIARGSGSTPFVGELGTFDPSALPDGPYTLLLTISDANGNQGVDRQAFTVLRDPALLGAFGPKVLGTSGESSPKFADLNGDGKEELILADQNGRVHAFRATGKELPGWPVAEDPSSTPVGRVKAGFISTPAVADLNGDGTPEVVVGGLDGKVYAWQATGQALPGWPVPTKVPPGPDPAHPHWESAVISSPAVGELDGSAADGPEVVVGGADGKVYAFHADGSTLAGFPVLLQDPNQPPQTAKVVSSPAIGDIDGDGAGEIVIGDGESYGTTARVYALRADGSYQPGWPVSITGLSTNGIPVIGQGVPESPVLADVNGDGAMEVAISGFTTRFHLLKGDGTEFGFAPGQLQFFSNFFGPNKGPDVTAIDARATVGDLAFGDIDRDGIPDLVSGFTDVRLANASLFPGQVHPFDHLLAAWHTRAGVGFTAGAQFKAFPRLLEDWTFLTAPVLADVDGDGVPEMVIGNGDGYVHAFRQDGSEPAGWPKYVGQWVQASVAAGDFDGNGTTDVAVVTRQGSLFVFATSGVAAGLDWPSLRGDRANTGAFPG